MNVAIQVTYDDYCKAYNIYQGIYAPLDHFVGYNEVESIGKDLRLTTGEFFPLPILLSSQQLDVDYIEIGNPTQLSYNGNIVGEIHVEEVYQLDKELLCQRIFKTCSISHPGVKYIMDSGQVFIAGKPIINIPPPFVNDSSYISPSDFKAIKESNGWKTCAGFQTRNIPHRAHEYLQRLALEVCDGLLIHPLVGWKKKGDFTIDAIVKSYTKLIDNYYPKDRVFYAHLYTPMFYAGPREALLHAIIRRNYGCTHFVVGRDHAGVGNFYDLYAAHEACIKHKDSIFGIDFLLFRGPYYCEKCNSIVTDKHCSHYNTEFSKSISGTQLRQLVADGSSIPPWLARSEVVESISIESLNHD